MHVVVIVASCCYSNYNTTFESPTATSSTTTAPMISAVEAPKSRKKPKSKNSNKPTMLADSYK